MFEGSTGRAPDHYTTSSWQNSVFEPEILPESAFLIRCASEWNCNPPAVAQAKRRQILERTGGNGA